MKSLLAPVSIFALLFANGAFAANCPAQLKDTEIQTLVGGKTLCATKDSERWQEFHSGTTGGSLIDYKKGPSDPVDPTSTVGSWSTGNAGNGHTDDRLIHTYGGTSYSWQVWDNCGGAYSLKGPNVGSTDYIFTIQGGQTPCP